MKERSIVKAGTIAAVFLMVILFMCGCEHEAVIDSGTKLYYVSGDMGSLIEFVYSDGEFDGLDDLVNSLSVPPDESRLRSVIPNASCNSVTLTDGSAYVDFSAEYGALEAPDRTLADACVVLTLTELDGIENVCITVDGEGDVFLSHNNLMLTEEVGTPEVFTVTVYQLDVFNGELVGDKRRIVLREGQTAQRCLFDEMVKTGVDESIVSIFPTKTRLLSSVLTDGTLTLDVSSEFLSPLQKNVERLIIQGIARSFTDIEGVEGIKITVNGEPLTVYGNVELPQLITGDF